MTELSDELLVAYVDGQLAQAQSLAVEKVLEQDAVVAGRVEALKDAHGRLESAFDAILAGAVGDVMAAVPMLPPRQMQPRRNGLPRVGIAIAFVGLALAALVAGYGWPPIASNRAELAPVADTDKAAPNWMDAALSAQALISRTSLEVSLESQSNPDLVALQMAQALGPAARLPNLETQGFKFVRGQLLRFGEQPLAQMLYLGAGKSPLALYALKGGSGDGKDAYRRSGALGSVSWSKDGISYLLAGEEEEPTLRRLAETIRSERPQAAGAGAGASPPASADPLVTGSN